MRGKITVPRIQLFVLILAMIVSAGVSPALQAASPGSWIQNLDCRQEGEQTIVTITADQALDYATAYPNPRLFLLDLPGANLQVGQKFFNWRTAQIDFATLSPISEGRQALVRIEFNLRQPVHFDLRPVGNQLLVTFTSVAPGNDSGASAPSEPRPATNASLSAGNKSVVTVADETEYRVTLATAALPVFKSFELQNPRRLVIDIDNTNFKTAPQVVALNLGPVDKVRFGYGDTKPGKIVRCVFDLSQKSTYKISSQESSLVVTFPKAGEAVAAAVTIPTRLLPPALADEPVSLGSAEQPGSAAGFFVAEPSLPALALMAPPAPQPVAVLEEMPLPEAVEVLPASSVPMQWQAEVSLPRPMVPEVASLANAESVEAVAERLPAPQLISNAPTVPTPALHLASMDLAQVAPPETGVQGSSQDFLKNINLAQLNAPPPVLATQAPEAPAPQEQPAAATAPSAAFAATPARPVVVQASAANKAPQYSGELISLDLKDADIKDFMRLIGNISGLNVVLDPDVKGSLTIFLNDVPWDQALDVVLKNNGLGKQLEGNVLRIATNSSLQKEEEQRKQLADARMSSSELQTETRVLSYAKAVDMSTILKKVLSNRGDIIVDPRTNTLIISDVPAKFAAIDNLIKQLDRKIRQVEIEARVIAANRNFARDIGIQWGILTGNTASNKVGGVTSGIATRDPAPSYTVTSSSSGVSDSVPLMVNLPANAATSGVTFLGGVSNNVLIDAAITAAESSGKAKLLSKPTIITQDNIEGFVQQGVKIPVQTTINNTVSTQFFDFSLALTVTPQITEEGTLILKVSITNSTPDFSQTVGGIPTVTTQETKTTVMVENGGTVVIGGVMIDQEENDLKQVPGFGNIPLLGYLFKNKSVTKKTQELIFFLSPKIL